jgi:hypothetical protein
MNEIVNLFVDGKITSKAEAAALVDAEAKEAAEFYGLPFETTKANILSNIGYVTGYLSHAQADRMMEMFDTEHPVWGRRHPSYEEAFELGLQYGRQERKENNWPPKSTKNLNAQSAEKPSTTPKS